MNTQPLHQQIRAARESRRLSVPALAERAGVAPGTVYRAERGDPISTDNLLTILSVLGHDIRLIRRRVPVVASKLKATGEAA